MHTTVVGHLNEDASAAVDRVNQQRKQARMMLSNQQDQQPTSMASMVQTTTAFGQITRVDQQRTTPWDQQANWANQREPTAVANPNEFGGQTLVNLISESRPQQQFYATTTTSVIAQQHQHQQQQQQQVPAEVSFSNLLHVCIVQ
jgi:hypothetical protein